MTTLVQYIGTANEKIITSGQLAEAGITSPTLVFSQSEDEDFYKSVPDVVAMFLLAQGDFRTYDGSTLLDVFEHNAAPEAAPEVLSVQVGEDGDQMAGSVVLPVDSLPAEPSMRTLGYGPHQAMPGDDPVRDEALRKNVFTGVGREVLVTDPDGQFMVVQMPNGTLLAGMEEGIEVLTFEQFLLIFGGGGFIPGIADLSDVDLTSDVPGYVLTRMESGGFALRPVPTLPSSVTIEGGRIGATTLELAEVDVADTTISVYNIAANSIALTFRVEVGSIGGALNLLLPNPELGSFILLHLEGTETVDLQWYVEGATSPGGDYPGFNVDGEAFVALFPKHNGETDYVWEIFPLGASSSGSGGGGGSLPMFEFHESSSLSADQLMNMLVNNSTDPIYIDVPYLLDVPVGSRFHFLRLNSGEFGVWPTDLAVTVTSDSDMRGIAPFGHAYLWKRSDNDFVLYGDLVAIDPPPDPDPPAEPMMFFRMSADTFDRADAPTLGAPDDGIPVLYEYDGDGTWEVSDNSAVFTGGSDGRHVVYCDTAGFGEFRFIVGAGDVGSTSELRIICGNVYYDLGSRTDGYIALNEAGEFWMSLEGEPESLVFTLTDFPGFVVGEEISIAYEFDGIFQLGFTVTVGSIFEQYVDTSTEYPSTPPGFGDYIGFEVNFVTGELPKSIQFWEVTHPASSLLVPKAFAGNRLANIEGGMTTGPGVHTTTYNGSWDWLEGSPFTEFGTSGYNAHYNAIDITEGDLRYTRIQFSVASVNQFVAGGFRQLRTRREVDPISEIVRHDGLLVRGSATEWLALLFSDDDGISAPRLLVVTDSGATETVLHTFGSAIFDALNIVPTEAGWSTIRAFIGADDVFWLQVNGVVESVDLSAETLPAGTEVGVLHRQTTDGAVPTIDRGIGWWTFDGYALT